MHTDHFFTAQNPGSKPNVYTQKFELFKFNKEHQGNKKLISVTCFDILNTFLSGCVLTKCAMKILSIVLYSSFEPTSL